ncbi:MAG TPA: DUF423 domain-containing protein [Chryseolinea sp.]|nr:DUF423 domain-containing protein [Chryseolinea sp.]
MNQRTTLICGATIAALAVIIGAFGAHELQQFLQTNGRSDTFETAVRYQFYHAFAMLITGILMTQFVSKRLPYAAILFLTGTVFFSGSLYVFCFTGVRALGAVTPLGGLLFIAGWLMLIAGVLKK